MKTILFQTFTLICVFFLIEYGISQSIVTGILKDSSDNAPLPYANIALLNQDSSYISGTITDDLGFFQIGIDTIGHYFLRISFIGYDIRVYPFELRSRIDVLELNDIYISKSGKDLSEVIIVGEKPIYSFDGEKKIYNVSEDPSIQNGVATDALQNAPGVFVDMEGNITLRGVSGVQIWINDKPSRIPGEGLKSFLQQLPANSIARIEVIDNPSARYGASGTGGIINIVTIEKIKRNLLYSFGLNGSTQTSFSPWLSFVTSNSKLSFSTYIGYSKFESEHKSASSGYVLNNGETIYELESNSMGNYSYSWMYGHTRLGWEISEKTSLDIWGSYSLSENNNRNIAATKRTMALGEIFAFQSDMNGEGKGNYQYTGISFEHIFKKEGHKIKFDGFGTFYENNSFSENSKIFQVQVQDNFKYMSNSEMSQNSFSGDLNYENPLNKNRKIESGVRFEYNTTIKYNPIDTFNFELQKYAHVPLFSNSNEQHTMNYALYSTYADTLWFINYKIGVRYEYGKLDMKSVALEQTLHRDYGTFFPTVHLSTRTKNNDNFTISYSRRVQYPQWELDPFENRVHIEYVHFGNPWLNPSFTDSYQAGYSKFFKSGSSLNGTLYHRRGKNEITDKSEGVFDEMLSRYTIYSTYVNAASRIYTGADASFRWRANNNVTVMCNFNVYNQQFYADLGSYVVDRDDFTYSGMMYFWWNYKFLRLNLTGNYRAASANFQGRTDPTYWINATVNADLFDKKLSLRLGMMDIFNWMEYAYNTTTPTYIVTSTSKRKTQFVTFGITVRLGKIELEQMQASPQMPMP